MRQVVSKLKASRAARNAAASYLAFGSNTVCSLAIIPLLVHFLSKEQIGMWLVISQITNYLLWLDLGVGNATARKIVPAVAANDHPEVDRWWSATRAVLHVQAIAVLVVGLALTGPFLGFLDLTDPGLSKDALWLYTGSVVLLALSMPLRGVPGLATAQQRFHWIPLGQAVLPVIKLAVFALFLNLGYGVRSYIAAMALGIGFNYLYFDYILRSGPYRPKWNRQGVSRDRLRSLFGYSIKFTVVGFVEALMNTLPSIIIARSGSLGGVAMYSFSGRGPFLASGLVRRTLHAFFPSLMNLHVTGQRERFKATYRSVSGLTISLGLVAAGGVLMINRSFVELIAGPEYLVESAAITWFAVGVISLPMTGISLALLQCGGNMAKSGTFALLQLLLAAGLGLVLFKSWGFAGLAAIFSLAPLLYTAYNFRRGARDCGYGMLEVCAPAVFGGLGAVAAVIAAGLLIQLDSSTGLLLSLFGKDFHSPNATQLGLGAFLMLIGAVIVIWHIRERWNAKRVVTPSAAGS